jgi:hypothetical protein
MELVDSKAFGGIVPVRIADIRVDRGTKHDSKCFLRVFTDLKQIIFGEFTSMSLPDLCSGFAEEMLHTINSMY